jgi:hypothetical protein
MVVVKAFMVAAVAILLLFAMLLLRNGLTTAKARVRADDRRRQPALRRLRQDPRTGVYYPAD